MNSTKNPKSIIEQLNRKKWWHSPPLDKCAYKKRGAFLASSYKECEFYGRPYDNPIEVHLSNPLIDTEENIIKRLFGSDSRQMDTYRSLLDIFSKTTLNTRFRLDAEIYKAAKKKGYDSIAIVTAAGMKKVEEKQLPRSIELNVFDINKSSLKEVKNASL